MDEIKENDQWFEIFLQKDLQYVIEAHIRIDGEEYNYNDSFAAFIDEKIYLNCVLQWNANVCYKLD